MMAARIAPRVLVNRHTGETLELRRVKRGDQVWLEINGTVPPHGDGPPLHVHYFEDEAATVQSGRLTAVIDGKTLTVNAGGDALLPKGSIHRWWNAENEPLVFRGYAKPLVDLDRYLQAGFEIFNASDGKRLPLFYIAHLAWRHRKTQAVRIGPAWVQAVIFPLVVAVGTVMGKYRGTEWPGCPDRCSDAPMCDD